MASVARESGEELPHDGTCDACEPDEAQCATHVCEDCGFSFCQLHSAEHSQKYKRHRMTDLGTLEGPSLAESPAESEEITEQEEEGTRKLDRKKCEEHGEDLTLYCKEHETMICVLCMVSGSHQQHEIITLNDAYEVMRNRDRVDLKVAMLEMVERLKFKCADSKVTQGDMKLCIQQEFNKVRHLVCEEEQKTLHLVDLQEALATAHTTEVLAEIEVRMATLMTEMAELTRQLNTFHELALLKPESINEETRVDDLPLPPQPPSQRNRRYNDEDPSPASGPC